MSILAPILRAARRLRAEAAEADLAFLEARAPHAIAEQRALVAHLRQRAGLPALAANSEDIRRQVEYRAKCRTVLS